jgi:hypothetical protein
MSRTPRAETFAPDEIATVHVMNRVVRRCFLMGTDSLTGKNYDYRKEWLEEELERVAAYFAVDCLNFAILSNHFHLILRSRPDVVATWTDREVARRWLMLCPKSTNQGAATRGRAQKQSSTREPTEPELNSIISDKRLLAELRSRLSDISWWMRLVCQRIAQWANFEDEQTGKFWQSRFKSVRLLDEEAILAGAAYVDLNPIRAALAETLELSEHTSVQRRIAALRTSLAHVSDESPAEQAEALPDAFLAPLEIDELKDELGARPSATGKRSSDKGFLAMSLAAYLELLDWTARQLVPGKRGATPGDSPPILERLQIEPDVWCSLVNDFGRLFSLVAGRPEHIDSHRSGQRGSRFHVPKAARQLLHC